MSEGTVKSGSPPNGYHPLPAGVACRCVRLWQDGKGNYWCCRPVAVEMLSSDPSKATGSKMELVQPAPATTPSEEDVARVLCEARSLRAVSPDIWADEMAHISEMEAKHPSYVNGFSTGTDALRQARAILALFAPILAEKEALADRMLVKIGQMAAEMGSLQTALADADRRALAAEAALAAERERCAQIAYRVCAETRHVTLGDKAAAAIRAQGE